jgi:hypothetical protein
VEDKAGWKAGVGIKKRMGSSSARGKQTRPGGKGRAAGRLKKKDKEKLCPKGCFK